MNQILAHTVSLGTLSGPPSGPCARQKKVSRGSRTWLLFFPFNLIVYDLVRYSKSLRQYLMSLTVQCRLLCKTLKSCWYFLHSVLGCWVVLAGRWRCPRSRGDRFCFGFWFFLGGWEGGLFLLRLKEGSAQFCLVKPNVGLQKKQTEKARCFTLLWVILFPLFWSWRRRNLRPLLPENKCKDVNNLQILTFFFKDFLKKINLRLLSLKAKKYILQ